MKLVDFYEPKCVWIIAGVGMSLAIVAAMMPIFFLTQHFYSPEDTQQASLNTVPEKNAPLEQSPCLYVPRWETYTSKQHGFSVQYPKEGYFLHITPTDGGVFFDNHPPLMPGHSVIGAVVRFLIYQKPFDDPEKPVESLMTMVEAASLPYGYEEVSITPDNICGRPVLRRKFLVKIGKNQVQTKYSEVYLPHQDRMMEATLELGNNYVGTPKETQYTDLFERILSTVRFFSPKQSR